MGGRVYRFRWGILGGWLAAGALLAVFVPALEPGANEPPSFLPADCAYSRAVEALAASFPQSSGLGEAVVVFERADGPMTAGDFQAVERIAAQIRRPRPPVSTAADLAGVHVRSPGSIPLPVNPLRSGDGRAALVVVSIPANFVTVRSARVVEHIRAVLGSAALPAGLSASVTGSAGFGRDYAEAGKRSHRRIGQVTLAAVVLILLLVYRAPLAALVPLAGISAAAFVAMHVLAVAQHFGMHVGTGERIFCFVLIYGAGMDYSLLFISRCREYLDAGLPAARAVGEGLGATLGAILASGGTDAIGLLMLSTATYGVFRTAGPAIAAALAVTLLAAVSLVPALVGLFGRRLFWPGRRMGHIGGRRLWPGLARRVVARPGRILAATVALAAVPAVSALRLEWVYDTLAELPARAAGGVGNAAAGLAAARRHWPVGQVAPVTVLLRAPTAAAEGDWRAAAARLTEAVSAVEGVRDVRSLSRPLGQEGERVGGARALALRAALALAAGKVRAEYVSADGKAMRLVVVLARPALTLEAMATVERVRSAVAAAAAAAGLDVEVHLAGATAEMMEIRRVTRQDTHRIVALVLGVIFVMVLLLLRDPLLAGFIVAATGLGYLATLGLTAWLLPLLGAAGRLLGPAAGLGGFSALAGGGGLDWKVEVFLFVVMVAVGVDYSIFLAARVAQEARTVPVAEAVERAVVRTGPVISSCGVIMAATLGSLMAGELRLFVQMGLAMGLGMLIDTFVVRPLLLPAFIALTGRAGRAARRRGAPGGRDGDDGQGA